MKCNKVFLCGLSAVGRVLATCFEAIDLDFNAFLMKDPLLSHEPRVINFVEEAFDAGALPL
jgi:nicotinamidase-related amidase